MRFMRVLSDPLAKYTSTMETGIPRFTTFFTSFMKSVVLCFSMPKLLNCPDSPVVAMGVFTASTMSGMFLPAMVPPTASMCSLIVLPIG